MRVIAVTVALLPALALASPHSNPSAQQILRPLGNEHLKIMVLTCNATIPKAPRSDCEALLADLDEETDSDEFFCPQLCRVPGSNLTALFGESRQHGKCRLQAVTNILGGEQTPTGCDGM
jgi:hypothetical protein